MKKIAIDALKPFAKLLEQAVAAGKQDAANVDCQIAVSDMRRAVAAIAALEAEPQRARMDRDAERGRLLLKWLRDGRIPGPAWGRPIKLVETCPQFGDETEVNNIEKLLDAALTATPPKD